LHLPDGSAEGSGEGTGRAGLDLDLGHFEGAESDISEDFGGGGTGKPDGRLVLLRELLAGKVHVGILEDFVKTVLEHSLERIADEGGAEALPDTPGALLSDERLEAGNETGVFFRVHLVKMGKERKGKKMIKGRRTCMLHFATSRGVIPA
jgi:hypothetical protein